MLAATEDADADGTAGDDVEIGEDEGDDVEVDDAEGDNDEGDDGGMRVEGITFVQTALNCTSI